jgi:hypothetical protein
MRALVRTLDTALAAAHTVANTHAEGGQGRQARRGINDKRQLAIDEGGFQFTHETSGRRQWLRTFYDGFELIGGCGFHAAYEMRQ